MLFLPLVMMMQMKAVGNSGQRSVVRLLLEERQTPFLAQVLAALKPLRSLRDCDFAVLADILTNPAAYIGADYAGASCRDAAARPCRH